MPLVLCVRTVRWNILLCLMVGDLRERKFVILPSLEDIVRPDEPSGTFEYPDLKSTSQKWCHRKMNPKHLVQFRSNILAIIGSIGNSEQTCLIRNQIAGSDNGTGSRSILTISATGALIPNLDRNQLKLHVQLDRGKSRMTMAALSVELYFSIWWTPLISRPR